MTKGNIVVLAKKEIDINYNKIAISYDETAKVYCINFWRDGWDGGDANVYITDKGKTTLIVYGE